MGRVKLKQKATRQLSDESMSTARKTSSPAAPRSLRNHRTLSECNSLLPSRGAPCVASKLPPQKNVATSPSPTIEECLVVWEILNYSKPEPQDT